MGSLDINRYEHPGKSDAEIAEYMAKKSGYIAVVRYKKFRNSPEFTNFGTCQIMEELHGYLGSPFCHDTEIIYDGRSTALRINTERW